MTTITVTSPAVVVAPRGAAWAADFAARALSFLGALIDRRAETVQRSTRAAEAAAVRRMADDVRTLDPRFAADLYAAADRHEV